MLSLEIIKEARETLRGVARLTPLMELPRLGKGLHVKAENLQLAGCYKIRGAHYKISTLTEEEKARGVVCCSVGNFAQGVAYAASRSGIRSVVCVPRGASRSKLAATRFYGGEIVEMNGNYFDEVLPLAIEYAKEKGMTFLHASEDYKTVAGLGSIGLEILEQLPETDIILGPIGSGGLMSGIACAVKSLKPSCKIYGVQLEEAPSMYESFRQGRVVTLDKVGPNFCDGMAGKRPGDKPFVWARKYLDDIVLVSDEEVAAALAALLEHGKILAEGAGAAPTAAVMFNKIDWQGKNVVAIISGGNIDGPVLSSALARGLAKLEKHSAA